MTSVLESPRASEQLSIFSEDTFSRYDHTGYAIIKSYFRTRRGRKDRLNKEINEDIANQRNSRNIY